MKKILITGMAGFVGFHLTQRLIQSFDIVGVDNINDYYSVDLKYGRLNELGIKNNIRYGESTSSRIYENLKFVKLNLEDKNELEKVFNDYKFDAVINLAAQAGVRYSLDHPEAYINSNIIGFFNILECCKNSNINKVLYASSSSVYGGNTKYPFSENDTTDNPVSFYAATKKCNEILAHTYFHLYGISLIGLRFFTVYGPWGRPDMAYFSFTEKLLKDEIINIYNNGKMKRDFTYIDDITNGIELLLNKSITNNEKEYNVYNIGNNKPVDLLDFVSTLEMLTNKKAKYVFKPMQPGDVIETYADIDKIQNSVEFHPSTNLQIGLKKFIEWYKKYYKI